MEIYTVTGDAMEPEYYDGDWVRVVPARELDFGEVGLFLVGTVQLLREYGPGGLYPKNPNYPMLPQEGVEIIGKVVGKVER